MENICSSGYFAVYSDTDPTLDQHWFYVSGHGTWQCSICSSSDGGGIGIVIRLIAPCGCVQLLQPAAFWGPGRYSDRSLFRQVDIPTGRYSDRSMFRQVVIPTGRYSDKQVVIPTGRYSDRSIFRQTVRYSGRSLFRQVDSPTNRSLFRQFDSSTNRSIFRKVYIPTGRYSDIKIIVMRGLTTINSYCGDE